MWATNYRTSDNIPSEFPGVLSDGRLFTNYRGDAELNNDIKNINNIRTNSEYRKFLVQNTNSIMKFNFNNMIKQTTTNQYPNQNFGQPYLYSSVQDSSMPIGYETSDLKSMYMSRQQLDDKKRRNVKMDYQ
jgi:hypothetical protein